MFFQFYNIFGCSIIAAKININGKTRIFATPAQKSRTKALSTMFDIIRNIESEPIVSTVLTEVTA